MMSRGRGFWFRVVVGAATVVGAVAVGVFFWNRWTKESYLVLEDGRRVRDVPASEAGIFAEPRFAHIRRRYLQNFERYLRMPMRDIRLNGLALEGEPQIRATLRAVISADPASREAVDRLPAGAERDLENAMLLVFARLAGLPRDQYRDRMRSERGWQGPPLLPEFWEEMPGTGNKASDDPEAKFAEYYDDFNLAKGRVVGVASDAQGWRVVIRSRGTQTKEARLMSETLSDADRELFGGGRGSVAHMFHRWPPDWASFAARHKSVTEASICVVVAKVNGDRHPIGVDLLYDPDTQRWRLRRVSERVTVRVVGQGRLAF